jgi:hypothetical protein
VLLGPVERQIEFGETRRGEFDGLPTLQARLDQLRANAKIPLGGNIEALALEIVQHENRIWSSAPGADEKSRPQRLMQRLTPLPVQLRTLWASRCGITEPWSIDTCSVRGKETLASATDEPALRQTSHVDAG